LERACGKTGFYLSIPFEKHEEGIDFVAGNGFQLEIRMTKVDHMMSLGGEDLGRIREKIDGFGLSVFTHGPFFGLDVASLDRNISEYSARCIAHGLDVTRALGGKVMVIHTGYLPLFSRGGKKHWLRNWAERMPAIVGKAGECGVRLALENTWDDEPEVLLRLADLAGSDKIGFCIDVGHVNVFSKLPLERWWDALSPRALALHIHDNDAVSDDHLVPGEGTFDFARLGSLLRELGRPLLLDLEVDMASAVESRKRLEEYFTGSGE